MEKQICLVVSDIDGTLIGQDESIALGLCGIGKTLGQKGIHFALASGRMPYELCGLREKLGIEGPCVYANGALIVQDSQMLWGKSIALREISSLVKDADAAGFSLVLSFLDGDKILANAPALLEKAKQFGRDYQVINLEKSLESDSQIYKMQLYDFHGVGFDLFEQAFVALGFAVVRYGEIGFEITAPQTNKGLGVGRLAELLGIAWEQVMAIGDYLNDLDMIRMAGVGVSVANAAPELRAQSDYICRNEVSAGVLEAIKKFCR